MAYTALVLLEANMNMMGHCGYRQPLWLAILQVSGGSHRAAAGAQV